jgi:hypothetical protein
LLRGCVIAKRCACRLQYGDGGYNPMEEHTGNGAYWGGGSDDGSHSGSGGMQREGAVLAESGGGGGGGDGDGGVPEQYRSYSEARARQKVGQAVSDCVREGWLRMVPAEAL